MEKAIEDCTVKELIDMCMLVKNCVECNFEKTTQVREDGGCPICGLDIYKHYIVEIPNKKEKNDGNT